MAFRRGRLANLVVGGSLIILATCGGSEDLIGRVDAATAYKRALMHLTGKGAVQDYDLVERWIFEAAMLDHEHASAIRACIKTGRAGVMLGPQPRVIEDLPTDTPELKRDAGLYYWQRSCDPAVTEKAASLLGAAAEAGLPRAEYMLGIAYHQGRGVNPDPARAALWFRRHRRRRRRRRGGITASLRTPPLEIELPTSVDGAAAGERTSVGRFGVVL